MDRSDSYASELKLYLAGIGLALVLSAIPFGLVAFAELSRLTLLIVIAVCAIMQVVAHFRFFLHIDLSRQIRAHALPLLGDHLNHETDRRADSMTRD